MGVWFVAATVVASAAVALILRRRRRATRLTATMEPVTKEWLARATAREDHVW